jgi:hypothetical protein
MSVWKEILVKDINELEALNYTKLNVIQQEIADMLQGKKLTRMEVFCILRGMMEKEMVNFEQAKKYYNKNYGAILEEESVKLEFTDTYKTN